MEHKLKLLEKWFGRMSSNVLIAFSGGVDSCLVAFMARKHLGKERVKAVISASPSLKRRDLEIAKDFCQRFDIPLDIIHTRELQDPDYASNPVDRCYFCKNNLYNDLKDLASEYPDAVILNGQNFDDLSDYRPGIKAAKEFKVHKPLADCNLSKEDIRAIAHQYDLPTWDKPSSPCLSSRVPYGQEITAQKLRQIEEAENLLNDMGFDDVRVRHYGISARIEVPADQVQKLRSLKDKIESEVLALGFKKVEIDEEGLVSGKLNRVLQQ